MSKAKDNDMTKDLASGFGKGAIAGTAIFIGMPLIGYGGLLLASTSLAYGALYTATGLATSLLGASYFYDSDSIGQRDIKEEVIKQAKATSESNVVEYVFKLLGAMAAVFSLSFAQRHMAQFLTKNAHNFPLVASIIGAGVVVKVGLDWGKGPDHDNSKNMYMQNGEEMINLHTRAVYKLNSQNTTTPELSK